MHVIYKYMLYIIHMCIFQCMIHTLLLSIPRLSLVFLNIKASRQCPLKVGIPRLVSHVVDHFDKDTQCSLFKGIVVCGGGSKLPDLVPRLKVIIYTKNFFFSFFFKESAIYSKPDPFFFFSLLSMGMSIKHTTKHLDCVGSLCSSQSA